MASLSRGQAAPRYLQLAGELRANIMAGRYGTETPFPTESELCATHSVSRFTVREALRRLQNEGLIARRRGSGTVVQPAGARGGALHQPLSNVGEILQYARDTRVTYEPAGTGQLPAWLAASIGLPTTGSWTLVQGVRTTADGDQPIAATMAYFHEMLGDAPARLDLAAGTLFRFCQFLSKLAHSKEAPQRGLAAQLAGAMACQCAALDEERARAGLRGDNAGSSWARRGANRPSPPCAES